MLTQAAGYAAMALGYVASAGGRPVLIKEIADAAEIPGPYLAKIVHTLARRGLVLTQRGVGGGVTLAKPADQISLFELCLALDDPAVQPRCMLGVAVCSDERACPAHKFWSAQRARYTDYLREMTIADVAAFEVRRRWKAVGAASLPTSTPARMNGVATILASVAPPIASMNDSTPRVLEPSPVVGPSSTAEPGVAAESQGRAN
ncbi:MAG: Rrf2 family transcriptional regulator [Planctomycetota bacterium]|nr:Rrf2 family transcriptional regulator [Planctomycetota bacterium]